MGSVQDVLSCVEPAHADFAHPGALVPFSSTDNSMRGPGGPRNQ